jgi:hypothetical protein
MPAMNDRRDLAPSVQLRRHVDRILAASAVGERDREDVAEELYGHLVERWRDALAAGADPSTVVGQVIEAFGRPEVVGPQLTAAYRSRLYATTLGLLLPVGVGSDDVTGYRRSVVILGLGIVGELALALLAAAVLAPLPALVIIATSVYLAGLSVLAIKALGRGLAWALAFVQVTCGIDLVATVVGAVVFGRTSILGVAIVVGIDLWIITGTSVPEEWPADNGRLRRLLIPFIIVTTIAAYGLQFGALVMPDPTQTNTTDLSMTVTASCPSTGPWLVTAQLTWTRTDLLGGRLIPAMHDEIGLSVGRDDGTAPAFPGDAMPAFDDDVTGGDLVDLATGATIHSDLSPGNEWSTPGSFYTGNRRFSIDPSWMQAGVPYATTFELPGAEADAGAIWGGRDGRFRLRYDHLARWGLEALVTCGRTVDAYAVSVR